MEWIKVEKIGGFILQKYLDKMTNYGWEVIQYSDDWGKTLEINTGSDGTVSYTVYLVPNEFTLIKNEFVLADDGLMQLYETHGGEHNDLSGVIWKIREMDGENEILH